MEVTLQQLLPCMLRQGIKAEIRQFQCKNDLLKQLPQRLAGYAQWLPETAMVLVIVDRDNDDCLELKARLEQLAHAAGLGTRKAPRNGKFQVINRIAIEELEAWFFGDWAAVKAAYPKVDAGVSKNPAVAAPMPFSAAPGKRWSVNCRKRLISNKACANWSWLNRWPSTWIFPRTAHPAFSA